MEIIPVMLSQLLSALRGKKERIVSLNLESGGPAPAVAKPYLPDHKVLIAQGAVSIQVTERRSEERMTAEVTVSLPIIKGVWKAELLTGQLRLFAADIDKVRRTQAGSVGLAVIPNTLTLIVLRDEKRQFLFAVDYRRIPGFGVHRLATLSLDPAEMRALIDSLQTADPGELSEERVRHLRDEVARASSAQPATPVPPPTPSVPAGKIVLTIGDEEISAAEFDHMLEAVPSQLRPRNRDEFARRFIHNRVATQEARRRKLDETAAFKDQLALAAEQLLTIALWKDLDAAIKVDEPACRTYHEEHPGEFDRIKVREILIRTPGSSFPVRIGQTALSDEQALAKAQEIRKKLLDGADFAAVAKEESDAFFSASHGGAVGWWDHGPPGSFFKESVRMPAFTLPLGEISEPLKDEHGYHLILVEEKQQRTYAQARVDAQHRLKAELRNKAEEQLQISAQVVLDPEYFACPDRPGGSPGDPESGADVASPRVMEKVPAEELKDPGFPRRTHVGGMMQAIKLIRGPAPVYPPEAKAAGISGHVTLYVVIAKDGTLLDVRPSTGHPLLITAAMEAVRTWVWRPTVVQGLAVEVVSRVDFEFNRSKRRER